MRGYSDDTSYGAGFLNTFDDHFSLNLGRGRCVVFQVRYFSTAYYSTNHENIFEDIIRLSARWICFNLLSKIFVNHNWVSQFLNDTHLAICMPMSERLCKGEISFPNQQCLRFEFNQRLNLILLNLKEWELLLPTGDYLLEAVHQSARQSEILEYSNATKKTSRFYVWGHSWLLCITHMYWIFPKSKCTWERNNVEELSIVIYISIVDNRNLKFKVCVPNP